MENSDDELEWHQTLDPYQKFVLLEKFYKHSLFPFLDWLHTSVSLTWQGLTEQITYECQFSGRQNKTVTVTKPLELQEQFIRFSDTHSSDSLSVQILVQLSVKPEFNHPNGTGALVAFQYINGYYHLSDNWTTSKIVRRVDQQLTLSESQQLIQDIQAHLVFVLANEHPSVMDPKSFYNSIND